MANEVSDWGCLVVKHGDSRFSDAKSFIDYAMDNELLAGDNDVDVGWGSIGETIQAYQDGEVDILCVFATDRSSLLPDVPTFNEVMEGYDITSPSDRGFALPAGVDQAVYDRWVQAMDKAINNAEFIAKMAELGQAVNYMGGQDYTDYA